MKDEYISISEFARRAGVSRQSVYKRIDNDLSGFCKVDKGKKVINTKGLGMFVVNQPVNQPVNQTVNQVDSQNTAIDALKKALELMENQNETLKTELAAKDRQIDQLQKLIDQEQQLHAATAQRLLLLEQPKDPSDPEPVEDPDQADPEPAPEIRAAAPDPEAKAKQSFWKRIFRG